MRYLAGQEPPCSRRPRAAPRELRDCRARCAARTAFRLIALLFLYPALCFSSPPKPTAVGQGSDALNDLRAEWMEARKWGLDTPDPAFKFDAAKYGGAGAKRNALVILIDFADKRGSVPPQNIQNLLFSVGEYSTGSLRDFYLENSYGLLDVQGEVVGWLRSSKEYSYYVDGSRGLNFGNEDRNARGMAEEALRLADPLVDFSLFDNDGPDGVPSSGDDDGYIDALLIVHAGAGSEETLDPNDILSHQSYFRDDLEMDGVRAVLYTTEPENGRVGVFCHEFGHTIGLPDLYDIRSNPGPAVGLGDWSLMATGVWRNDGRTPAHLDAWSKVALGFVDPVVPESNESHVPLPPVEEEPVVYKIWKNGRPGTEYFLVEHRSETGFDSALPGFGALIYHVDESVRLQTDPMRYKVALVQADGRRQLETQFGNYGDTGDPFPGATANTSFTPFSDPNSLDYDGADTQVSLNDIEYTLSTFQGGYEPEMTFGLEVETAPQFVLEGVTVDDRNGDGDGLVNVLGHEPGHVEAVVRNVGLGASGLEVGIACAGCEDSALIVDPEAAVVGSVGADSSFVISFDFRLNEHIIPLDPLPLAVEMPFNLRLTDSGVGSWNVPFAAGAGVRFGIFDDFELSYLPYHWNHEEVTEGRSDAWEMTQARAHSGSFSWGFTGAGAYPNNSDGGLTSPAVLLAPNSQLTFFYWVEAESLGSSIAWDGARVEISNNGGPWTPLAPSGGYDFFLTEFSDTPLVTAGVFSGARDWTRAAVDLSGYSGVARFRFRFVSDGTIGGEGFYIDDFAVVSRNYTTVIESLTDTAEGVEIELGITETSGPYDGRGFNVYRRREGSRATASDGALPAGYSLLNGSPLSPVGNRVEYLDETAGRGRAYLYIVEDLGPGDPAAPLLLGPERIYLCLVGARPFLETPYPVPFTPGAGRALTLPVGAPDPECAQAGAAATAQLFDATGRLVRDLRPGTVGPGIGEILWDGRDDDGEIVPSGVYFWRVEISGDVLATKVILIR